MQASEAGTVVWEFLHDAVLSRITVDWETGTAALILDSCEEPSRRVEIKAEGLRLLHCPRQEPWGQGGAPSVNDLRQYQTDDGGKRLIVETQSGDQIEVEARQINLTVS